MEVDRVIVTSISRDISTLKAEDKTIEVFASDEVVVKFLYLINNQGFESKTWLIVDENKTIEDIESIIKDMMNGKRN